MKYNAMMNWEENFQDQLTVKIQSTMKNKTVLFKNSYLVDVYQQGGILISKLESAEGFQLILKTTPNSELSNRLLKGDLRNQGLSVIADVQELIVPQIALNSHNVDGKYAEISVNTDTIRVVNGSLVDFIVEE